MGNTLSTLKPPRGARHRPKRLGRGTGSGLGKTSGKGQKGQLSRSGHDVRRGFEGGQMPLQRRLPKRGFKNLFRKDFAPVNVADLNKKFEQGGTVEPETLKQVGLVPRSAERVKILGNGEIAIALTVKAHGFSKAALAKIAAAGGTTELIKKEVRPVGKKKDPKTASLSAQSGEAEGGGAEGKA